MSTANNDCNLQSIVLQLVQQNHQLIQLISKLVQINNEQNAQINELLIRLEDEAEEPSSSRNLDD